MARRSDHSRDELYDMALTAARSIVAQHGLEALTARRVAQEIGYSPGTLYNIFHNQDDMIIHMNAATIDGLRDALAAVPLPIGEAPRPYIEALLSAYLGYIEQNVELWRALFDFQLSADTEAPAWYMDKIGRVLSILSSALAPLYPAGQEDQTAKDTRVLWASLHGITSLAVDGKLSFVTGMTAQEIAPRLLHVFLAGISSAAPSKA